MVVPLVAAGCSVIYDPDRLPTEATDAATDDAVDGSLDAEGPPMLTSAEALELYEGMGTGGSRRALIAAHGRRLDERPFGLELDGRALTPPAVDISSDGTLAILAFAIPVDTGRVGVKPLKVRFGNNSTIDTVEVSATMLPELELAGPFIGVDPVYSSVRVSADVLVPTGSGPLVLRSASSIVIEQDLRADATGAVGGRGACMVNCPGAGRPGTGDSAGGGAGFGTAGSAGEGNGASGGPTTGTPALGSIGVNANRGQPGGEGDPGGSDGPGLGGGGGGALALWADGDLTIAPGASVTAAGGNGGHGAQPDMGNGGGGGSGGAIYLRAGGTITGAAASVAAPGGPGAIDRHRGGDGGDGRVRVDAATYPAPLVTRAAQFRGPSARSVPLTTDRATIDVTVTGQPSTFVIGRVGDTMLPLATVGANGEVTFTTVPLELGLNLLCINAPPPAPLSLENCMIVGRY